MVSAAFVLLLIPPLDETRLTGRTDCCVFSFLLGGSRKKFCRWHHLLLLKSCNEAAGLFYFPTCHAVAVWLCLLHGSLFQSVSYSWAGVRAEGSALLHSEDSHVLLTFSSRRKTSPSTLLLTRSHGSEVFLAGLSLFSSPLHSNLKVWWSSEKCICF